jgi:hypothetical protein
MFKTAIMAALVLGAPAAPEAPAPRVDTVVAVQRGARLEVDNHRGEVVIGTWGRDAVRVEAEESSRHVVDVVRTGSTVRVRPRSRRGGPGTADLRITVPAWLDLRVEGNQLDVEIEGSAAEVSVETVGGDIAVSGGSGLVSLRSIQGDIRLRNARGRIEVISVNEEIVLEDVEGDLYVETTNGDISLRDVRSTNTRATTVNGDIEYDGTIRNDGRYAFSTHNGDVSVTVARDANATVHVSTYHGEFESAFPVQLTGTTRDRQFHFTLGTGSARLELESFNGEIQLRRPR